MIQSCLDLLIHPSIAYPVSFPWVSDFPFEEGFFDRTLDESGILRASAKVSGPTNDQVAGQLVIWIVAKVLQSVLNVDCPDT